MRPAATYWSWTARAMALGAAYDGAFALAILLFPEPSSALLRIPLPADRLYFGLAGVLLLLLAALYVLPAREPRRYQGVVLVSSAGRFLGFLYLGWAWSRGAPGAFLGLAVTDLVLAAAQALLLRSARKAEGSR